MRLVALAFVLLAHAASAQSLSGVLEEGDSVRENDARYDEHTVEVATNEQVAISMLSDDFDAFLIVRGPGGAEWTNDDAGGSRNAGVELIAESGGTFTIWASGFGSQDLGAYTVVVDRQGAVEMTVTEGRLDYKDDETIKGEFVDRHEIELAAERSHLVELLSLGFDGFLRLESPSGEVWRNDDAGTTTLSRIGPVEGEAGTWTVHITTVRAGEVGAYDLRVITRAE